MILCLKGRQQSCVSTQHKNVFRIIRLLVLNTSTPARRWLMYSQDCSLYKRMSYILNDWWQKEHYGELPKSEDLNNRRTMVKPELLQNVKRPTFKAKYKLLRHKRSIEIYIDRATRWYWFIGETAQTRLASCGRLSLIKIAYFTIKLNDSFLKIPVRSIRAV